jgi:chromosome partitioning protein
MALNPKGGSGKSTLATNMASFFAATGNMVALADFDPQRTSLEWLEAREPDRPPVLGMEACNTAFRAPRKCDVLVLDAPAGVHGKHLTDLVRRAETVVIPVLPSPFDMRACAHFIAELLTVGKVVRHRTKVAVVANRVRENTLAYTSLHAFLKRLRIPFIASLRDSQNYIRAAERGLGIFELTPSLAADDLEHWRPLLRWLNSKRSLPDV